MEVLDIRLLKSEYSMNANYSLPDNEDYTIGTKLGYKADFDDKSKIVTAVLKIKTEGKDAPYTFSIEFGGKFKLSEDDELTDDVISRVCKINSPAIIFPYIREYIADISRRGGFPPMHIDPVNFVKLAEEMESPSEE